MTDIKPVIIRLKQQYSWQSTYHKYPFYLAEADSNRFYTREEVYIDIFKTGSAPVTRGKGQHQWVESAFGLQPDIPYHDVTIEGIGLIESIGPGKYKLSHEAIELGQSYAHDPAGKTWRVKFAEIIARNDVRTRAILFHMGILGYGLSFPDDDSYLGFGKIMGHAQLVASSEKISLLREVDQSETNGGRKWVFSQLLDRYRFEILGPFLAEKIGQAGLDLSDGIEYRGGKVVARNRMHEFVEPTTQDLSSSLKQSLLLFKDLDVIAFDPLQKLWVINYSKARDLFEARVISDLFIDRRDEQFEDLLYQMYRQLADQDGYTRITELRRAICERLNISSGESIQYFDRQVARLMSEGRLSLGKTMGWHGSATEALFGDRSKEFVEFVF
jgi:hypothetical protein